MAWTRQLSSGRYQACWRDPNGRMRTQTFRRKGDAQRFLTGLEADMLRGSYDDPKLGRETLSAFWMRWRAGAETMLRPATLSRYDAHWRCYLEPSLGAHRLGSITRLDVENFMGTLATRQVGASARGSVLRLLHRLLAAAVDGGVIGRNPSTGVRAPTTPQTEMRFITPAEIAELVDAVPTRYRALVLVGAYGGLRFGEIAALRLDRIDFLQRTVRVEEAYAEVDGRLHRGPTKTGTRRAVTLPTIVVDELARHVQLYPPGAGGLVFTDEAGGALRRSNFGKRVWRRAVGDAGLAPLRFHDLRHTSVALAIAAGAHPKQIQARAGHSSIRTTLDRYGHLFEGLDGELADRLDEFARTATQKPGAAGLLLAGAERGRKPSGR